MTALGLTVAAERHVCGCQRLRSADHVKAMKSTILTLEGACSASQARTILALHPAPLLDFTSGLDIQ